MSSDPTRLKSAKDLSHSGIFFGLARVPNTQRVFVGLSDFKVYHVDLAAEKPEWQELGAHESYVNGVALAGPYVVSGGWDGKLIWWNAETREQVRKVDAHEKWIRGVTASRDGRFVSSVSDDMICKVWNAETGELVHALAGHEPITPHHYPSMLFVSAFSRDGNLLATADKIGHVVVWDLASGKQIATVEAPTMYTWDPRQRRHSIGGVRSLAFSPDAKLLAVGGTGQINNIDHLEVGCRLEIFDWQAGKRTMEQAVDKHKGLIERLEFSPAGDWLVTAGGANDGFVVFFNAADGKPLHLEKAPMHVYDFEMNEAADEFIACGHGKLVCYEFKADAPAEAEKKESE
jgi:WD40 repeat protein